MSCTIRGCGFGKIKTNIKALRVNRKMLKILSRKSHKSHKSRKSRKSRKLRRSRKSRKQRRSRKSLRSRRSRKFGFKYLRNDQIINSVFHNYPQNLTCDRA